MNAPTEHLLGLRIFGQLLRDVSSNAQTLAVLCRVELLETASRTSTVGAKNQTCMLSESPWSCLVS